MLVADEPRARQYLERIGYYRDPYLVDAKGRFYPAEIPDLSGFAEVEGGDNQYEYSVANQRFVQ
jgi:hypothetical protein